MGKKKGEEAPKSIPSEFADVSHEYLYLLEKTQKIQMEELKVCTWKSSEDGFRWEGYGSRRLSDGTPNRKAYFRCVHVRGPKHCQAKKIVEEHPDDPRVVIVTYKGRHSHDSNRPLSELHPILRLLHQPHLSEYFRDLDPAAQQPPPAAPPPPAPAHVPAPAPASVPPAKPTDQMFADTNVGLQTSPAVLQQSHNAALLLALRNSNPPSSPSSSGLAHRQSFSQQPGSLFRHGSSINQLPVMLPQQSAPACFDSDSRNSPPPPPITTSSFKSDSLPAGIFSQHNSVTLPIEDVRPPSHAQSSEEPFNSSMASKLALENMDSKYRSTNSVFSFASISSFHSLGSVFGDKKSAKDPLQRGVEKRERKRHRSLTGSAPLSVDTLIHHDAAPNKKRRGLVPNNSTHHQSQPLLTDSQTSEPMEGKPKSDPLTKISRVMQDNILLRGGDEVQAAPTPRPQPPSTTPTTASPAVAPAATNSSPAVAQDPLALLKSQIANGAVDITSFLTSDDAQGQQAMIANLILRDGNFNSQVLALFGSKG